MLTGFDHGADGGGVFGLRAEHDNGWRPNSRYDLGQGHMRLERDVTRSTTLDAGAELYGARWDSPGYLSEAEFARPRGEITVGSEGRWDHSHYQNWFTTDRSRDSSALLVTARQLSGALFVYR